MTPSNEGWTAVIILGFALIGVGVALWFHARRELTKATTHRHRKREDDSESDPEAGAGRHALRDPNAALAGILSQVAPRAAPGGQHRAD